LTVIEQHLNIKKWTKIWEAGNTESVGVHKAKEADIKMSQEECDE
jgi:hypothetical protein